MRHPFSSSAENPLDVLDAMAMVYFICSRGEISKASGPYLVPTYICTKVHTWNLRVIIQAWDILNSDTPTPNTNHRPCTMKLLHKYYAKPRAASKTT